MRLQFSLIHFPFTNNQTMFFKSVCFVLCLFTNCFCFDFNDLKNINGSCYDRGSCRVGRGSRLDVSLDWKLTNCFCDDACIEYGDCCLEAKAFDASRMKEAITRHDCINVKPFGSYYMQGNCASEWEGDEIADLCRRASPESELLLEDPFLDTPVTSLKTDVTYKNSYCAVCNNESVEHLEVWKARLSCPEIINVEKDFIEKNVQFVNGTWGLYINSSEGEQFHVCLVSLAIAETVLHKIRRCKDFVMDCSPKWTDKEVEELCYSYTTIVYGPAASSNDDNESKFPFPQFSLTNSKTYRNHHCAICNFVDSSDLVCYERNFRTTAQDFDPLSLSVLFDFGVKLTSCSIGEIWDPFSKTCRQVVCLENNSEFRYGRCVKLFDKVLETTTDNLLMVNDNSTNEHLNDTKIDGKQARKCDKMFLNESDFTRGPNASIVVHIFRRTYKEGEYDLYKEGILVCIPNSYSRLMGWLTLLGLGLSCICIFIHLATFFLVPDLRNLSGKNLASLCISLLIAYICFLITTFEEYGTNGCPILASAMYYFFIASFAWMNVMAFDIWRTLQLATSELRVTAGKQWKKFFAYSAYAWLLPAALLLTVLYIDFVKPSGIDPSFLPEFGQNLCWFGQRKAILVYFAAPLATIMLLNIIFFFLAVRMVALTASSTMTLSTSQPQQIQLKLYLRLALLMGLSWISGIVGGYIQEEYMWYVFILLNAFQGIFILIGFTCTKKVFRALQGNRSKLFTTSYGKTGSKNSSSSRQVLESQDSNHSNLSNTSTSNLSITTSKISVHSP